VESPNYTLCAVQKVVNIITISANALNCAIHGHWFVKVLR